MEYETFEEWLKSRSVMIQELCGMYPIGCQVCVDGCNRICVDGGETMYVIGYAETVSQNVWALRVSDYFWDGTEESYKEMFDRKKYVLVGFVGWEGSIVL